MIKTVMYFGRGKRQADGYLNPVYVSAEQFEKFMVDVIGPRFPLGFTHVMAEGFWRYSSGNTMQEKTEIVVIIHGEQEEHAIKVDFIAEEYCLMFQQESVMLESSTVNVKFS